MPKVRISTAVIANAGARIKPRRPELESCAASSSQFHPHASRDCSSSRCVSPNFAGSCMIRDARASPHELALVTPAIEQMPDAPEKGAHRGLQDGRDGIRHPLIVVLLGFELLQALGRDAIAADLPAGVGRRPLRLHPAVGEQLLQRGIERAFLDAELIARQVADLLRNRVTVERLLPNTRRISITSVPGGRPAALGIV